MDKFLLLLQWAIRKKNKSIYYEYEGQGLYSVQEQDHRNYKSAERYMKKSEKVTMKYYF